MEKNKISVIVPTYRRPDSLKKCLHGLKDQQRKADEIIIIVRDSDVETWNFLNKFDADSLGLKTVKVSVQGVIAALNKGIEAAGGDIISFTDDDAVPQSDWLELIEKEFEKDVKIGAVGGKDNVYKNNLLLKGKKKTVGKLQFFGRQIGNHHLGFGKARKVDFLKGVNMSFRSDAIKNLYLGTNLAGTGAQVHWELAFCLEIKKRGWTLIYDPNLKVDHYDAKRFDEDQRGVFNASAWANAVHNESYILFKYLNPVQRWIFLVWVSLIGTRANFGMFQWLRLFPFEGKLATKKWLASIEGRKKGWNTWREHRK